MEYSRGTVTESEGLETTKAQPREAEPRVTINQTVLINQSTNTGSPEDHDINSDDAACQCHTVLYSGCWVCVCDVRLLWPAAAG